MALQDRLDALRAQFEAKAPKDVLEIMHRAVENIRQSGLLATTLKVGDKAPDFILPNATGQPVSARNLLDKSPLVVSFYRGKW